jgi:hypothetical protein
LSMSTKIPMGFNGVVFSLQISLKRNAMLAILSLSTHKCCLPPHLFRLLWFTLKCFYSSLFCLENFYSSSGDECSLSLFWSETSLFYCVAGERLKWT